MFVCKHESIASLLFICNSRLLAQVVSSPLVYLHHEAINNNNTTVVTKQIQRCVKGGAYSSGRSLKQGA